MKKRPKLPDQALDFFRATGAEGGRKRARTLSPERRSESARKAVKARWAKVRQNSSS